MKRIDPADLSIFLAIGSHRSFRKAATELGLTASALSHALRNLEERLGLRLVNRTTRSVALTEAGGRLFNRVKPAFRDISDALEDLNSFRSAPVGALRINAAKTSAELVLLPVVTRFLRAFPEVTVDIVVDNGLTDVVAGGFDAGVRFGETIAGDMIAIPLGQRQRSAIIAAPDFFKIRAMPQHPRDLLSLPCIRYRFPDGRFYRWEFERGGTELEIEVEGPLTLDDQDLMVNAALDGAGIAYVFEGLVERHLAEGRLVRLLEDWCPYYPGFFLYYPGRRQLPAALRAFVDFIKATKL